MNLDARSISNSHRHSAPPVAFRGSSPAALAEIYRADVNLAILERTLEHRVATYAEFLCGQSEHITFKRMLSIQTIKPALREHLPLHPDIEPFIQDIDDAASMLGCLFDTDNVGLRLHSVDHAPCPRFHTDKVPARLLLTYHGAGTQWLDEHNLDRQWLGPARPGDKGMRMCLNEHRIHEIACGHIAICKGDGWEGSEGRGLVHRSPPLHASSRRLVLSIDLG